MDISYTSKVINIVVFQTLKMTCESYDRLATVPEAEGKDGLVRRVAGAQPGASSVGAPLL